MTVGTPGFVAGRLTEARQAFGLTKVALAEMINVSPMAISQYESGPQTPRPDVMDRLSEKLGFPRSFFLSQPWSEDNDDPTFWRSNASATQIARERCHPRLRWLKEITSYQREFLDFPKLELPPIRAPEDFRTLTSAQIEHIAQECRDWWNFGSGPIPDLLLELENSGVITARINVAAESLDAFSQWSSSFRIPFVVLGKDKASAVRSRFDAAHELAHLLLHRRVDRRRVRNTADWKVLEQQAHRFAAALLLPAKSFVDELWAPTLDGMLSRKERWRVSIGMMIVRCEHIGLINQDQARRLWINYNRRGWRGEEPLDAVLNSEQPRVLRRGFEALIENKIRTKGEIVAELCLPAREIEELAALPRGYFSGNDADVKAFPRLKSQTEGVPSSNNDGAEIISLVDRKKPS
ncbi:ImmA/IrrE family metallo-endopeptidase [Bradyrhizobium sp. 159]|uniref:XRE family transcriptional regulator n=1 Tax=Bradyrhizobium sp. 159 TaxID=2782632 RepID=UPI001FFB9EE8|nr:XRE family transcriptional regulator [Bradyrhizobium sp. 159]MCK1619144.1 ImmA/IrrE family metallo-endopeptidase [Bradyrhizobium sp. 159]